MILQGREVSDADIELIRSLMAAHPTSGQTPLSVELCRRWNWRNAQGQRNLILYAGDGHMFNIFNLYGRNIGTPEAKTEGKLAIPPGKHL